jgi:hypothetical protein
MDEDLKRVAEAAAQYAPGKWQRLNDAIGADEDGGAYERIALTPCPNSPEKSGRRRTWRQVSEHIATFDPPTVLSLLDRLSEAEAENARLREALKASREGLSIAAGWARSKPDSQRARDKIKHGLDAIRVALNPTKAAKAPSQET